LTIPPSATDWSKLSQVRATVGALTRKPPLLFNLLPTQISYPMVANSDMAVCLSAVRPELLALCDQLEQQLNQADQQRRRLLEAVLAEALVEPEKTLEAAYA
jgi:hypothetical protein